jgi:hypothetical protein
MPVETQTKTPLVDRVKDAIAYGICAVETYAEAEADDRNCVDEDFKKAYISEHVGGCCPEEWIGDGGLLDAIMDKFWYVYRPVGDEVVRRTGIPRHKLISMIEPNWEDTVRAAILYDPWNTDGKMALCYFESTKAWHFCWDSEWEMEKALQAMVSDVIEALRKAGVVKS